MVPAMIPAAVPSLADLLRFYAEAGVDAALDELPIDRFEETARAAARRQEAQRPSPSLPPSRGADPRAAAPAAAAPTRPPAAPAVIPSALVVPDEQQAALARSLAAAAPTLTALREALAGFDGCNLKSTAKSLVFADGNPQADVMFIGEAPGRDEDLEGLPFVGRSGQLLDRMLAAIGLDRTGAYIANVIPWRPPGNRTPTPLETEICRPFVERQIELVNPKLIVTLGGPSSKVILKVSEGILRLRGNWHVHRTGSGVDIPVMPTLHPAYLLRNPAHKKLAWRDFLEAKVRLKALQAG